MAYEDYSVAPDPKWPVLSDRVGVQDRHDFARKATPINADDGAEKIQRLATALITCTDPNARSLMMRELGRLEWLIAKGERH